tara:strand:+ start:453 stop:764 length:312 start_codon:yes stop_codon:yes gene_type:complete
MILHDVNTLNKYIDSTDKSYWTMAINWTSEYDFLPSVVHGSSSAPDNIIVFIMGLDHSQKDEFGITEEQLLSTWKAFSATLNYPNDPKAFGINGNTWNHQWRY